MVIHIPLSKQGKYARLYEAIVDDCDTDIAAYRWCVFIKKYAKRHIRNHDGALRSVYLHRVIMERVLGRPLQKGEEVDHINLDGLDNRRENLRLASRTENQRNVGRIRTNTSGYKGVYWVARIEKWQASIQVNGKQKHLGYFEERLQAYAVYCNAAYYFFGEFANYGDTDHERIYR